MRFQVPQFIEVEDKIFGPFTFKQFVYLAGGGGAALALWLLIPWRIVAIIIALPIVALALALAFYKYNSKPFSSFLEALFKYSTNHKLYIWKKRAKKPRATKDSFASSSSSFIPQLSQSKLKDLTWELDVADSDLAVDKKQTESQTEGESNKSKHIRSISNRQRVGGKQPAL